MPIISTRNCSRFILQLACCWLFLLVLVIAGCSKSPELATTAFIEDGISAVDKEEDEITQEARKFFSEWLADHGETNIVNDETGVGVANNATRLWAFRYGPNGSPSPEVEFRIVLPDGREIVEFVAGIGASENAAEESSMAMLNFCMSTFHVVYSCFMNLDDPHMSHEDVTIGGNEFILTSGGMVAFSSENSTPDFSEISEQIEALLTSSGLELSAQTHWLKIVYGQHQGKAITTSVTLDNEEELMLTDKVSRLSWPQSDGFYVAKEFMVLRHKGPVAQ